MARTDGAIYLGGSSAGDTLQIFSDYQHRLVKRDGALAALPALLDVDGNGAAEALTDGFLLFRWLVGLRGAALVAGAVDLAGCARCDAPAIENYLAGLTDA